MDPGGPPSSRSSRDALRSEKRRFNRCNAVTGSDKYKLLLHLITQLDLTRSWSLPTARNQVTAYSGKNLSRDGIQRAQLLLAVRSKSGVRNTGQTSATVPLAEYWWQTRWAGRGFTVDRYHHVIQLPPCRWTRKTTRSTVSAAPAGPAAKGTSHQFCLARMMLFQIHAD